MFRHSPESLEPDVRRVVHTHVHPGLSDLDFCKLNLNNLNTGELKHCRFTTDSDAEIFHQIKAVSVCKIISV